jgi:hypothetical protein
MPEIMHPLWDGPGWLHEIRDWTAASMATAGIESDESLVEHQRRPWSVVFTLDSSRGRLFFKSVINELRPEAALHQALVGSHPDAVPPLVAADRDRGWLLMEDAGQPLRCSVRSVHDIDQVAAALVRMAQLQISWLPNAQELLDLGAMDRRPNSLPDAFARLIGDPGALASGHSEGLSDDEATRLVNLQPRVKELCRRLAGWGPPPTLHHDDFHDANIYLNHGKYVFADWGEAGVAHPFFTPMIALRALSWRLDLPPGSPELARLRDAYLGVWESFGAPRDMRRAYDLAQRLAPISRALTWHRVMSAVPAGARGEDATAAASWLRIALARIEDVGRTSSPA